MYKNLDLSNLPRKNGRYDWQSCAGRQVTFYWENEGENNSVIINIVKVYRKRMGKRNQSYISVAINGNVRDMRLSNFLRCNLLTFINSAADYIKTTDTGQITIRDCPSIDTPKGKVISWNQLVGHEVEYDYNGIHGKFTIAENEKRSVIVECDGRSHIIAKNNLLRGHIGGVIGARKAPKKITYPKLVNDPDMQYYCECLVNQDDKYKYTSGSMRNKLRLKCKICHQEIEMTPSAYKKAGHLQCLCSSGIKFPEKYIYELLSQLKNKGKIKEFIPQLSRKKESWCGSYIYDFKVVGNPSHQIIIEVNGIQHYIDCPFNGYDVQRQITRDDAKRKLAYEHGYTSATYIAVDCRKSDPVFIQRQIKVSDLLPALCVTEDDVDWELCSQKARDHMSDDIIAAYDKNNNLSCADLSKMFGISDTSIRRYLVSAGRYDARDGWVKGGRKRAGRYKYDVKAIVSYYTSSRKNPCNYESLQAIADKFHCSYNYLLNMLRKENVYDVDRERDIKRANIYLTKNADWNKHYEELVHYKAENGSLRFPRGYRSESGCVLEKWLRHQFEGEKRLQDLHIPIQQERMAKLRALISDDSGRGDRHAE